MPHPKASLIIAVYKDLEALRLILDALRRQTYPHFEVVVAEDDDSPETPDLLADYSDLTLVHVSHPDIGRTKQAAQNKAVCASRGEYLIFIDGDCIPYSTFIEGHLSLSAPRQVLSGRRVNLPDGLSSALRQGHLSPPRLEHRYFWYFLKSLAWDREVRAEQGLYFRPDGIVYKRFLASRERHTQILGCNFSCHRHDFFAINGFDESYGRSILGDDNDLNWRFPDYGATLRSCKNVANVFHLHHQRPSYEYDPTEDLRRFNERKAAHQYRCEQGLSQYCRDAAVENAAKERSPGTNGS
jgi:glycosyltransferase involved in cell wall biosynthesis